MFYPSEFCEHKRVENNAFNHVDQCFSTFFVSWWRDCPLLYDNKRHPGREPLMWIFRVYARIQICKCWRPMVLITWKPLDVITSFFDQIASKKYYVIINKLMVRLNSDHSRCLIILIVITISDFHSKNTTGSVIFFKVFNSHGIWFKKNDFSLLCPRQLFSRQNNE